MDWVSRSNFRNPTVKFYAKLAIPFERSNYAKFCMSPSLVRTMPECVISQENNSPLTLYIEFHNLFPWISIVQLIKFNQKCMHNHLSPNIPNNNNNNVPFLYSAYHIQLASLCARGIITPALALMQPFSAKSIRRNKFLLGTHLLHLGRERQLWTKCLV